MTIAPARTVFGFDDPTLARLHVEYAVTGDRCIRNRLAEAYDPLAVSLARRFPTRRESFEDLAQVARMGMLLAVERFDPGRGRPFPAFARVTVEGELKRHVRDRTWVVRVPRSLQEHYLVVIRTVEDLTGELGRSPRVAEVARRAGLTEDAVLEAMELAANQHPTSLDRPEVDGAPRRELAGAESPFAPVEERDLLASLLARLPALPARVLRLRFVEGLTQAEIGTRIGMSQMGVSRLLSRTLAQLATRAGDAR